jgi:hypothetical protein
MARGEDRDKPKQRKGPKPKNKHPDIKYGEGAGAILAGMSEFPISLSRYFNHAAVWLASHAENFTEKELAEIHRRISTAHDDPAIYSDRINKYRNHLMKKYPKTASGGEIAAEVLTGAALLKKFITLGKGGTNKLFKNKLTGSSSNHRGKVIGGALAAGLAFEGVVDPALEGYIEAGTGSDKPFSSLDYLQDVKSLSQETKDKLPQDSQDRENMPRGEDIPIGNGPALNNEMSYEEMQSSLEDLPSSNQKAKRESMRKFMAAREKARQDKRAKEESEKETESSTPNFGSVFAGERLEERRKKERKEDKGSGNLTYLD